MKSPLAPEGVLTPWLRRAPSFIFVFYAIATAFSTYFCMYAFRKPFAAATFADQSFLGSAVALKTALVISQILGYALSKYIGIKVCSEVMASRRAWTLIGLILCAQTALLAYGFLPPDWKVVAIFFNGLPLGMIWGLVVWYLEGRRTSELLLAGLSCSYIVSSGLVKDIGRAMMAGDVATWWGHVPGVGGLIAAGLGKVSEAWMPAVVGFHFLPLFLASVWLLKQLPQPDAADVADRAARVPMTGAARIEFLRQFMVGMGLLCFAYFFLTAYRDFRDNYQVEIFDNLGYAYAKNQTIISRTELVVAFGVMGALALLNVIKDNRKGLIGAFVLMSSGLGLIGAATLALDAGWISGFWWMTLTGLGSYLAYVPFGSILFDRLMALTRTVGTSVFAIYVADAIGYTGSVGVQLFKDLAQSDLSRLGFFRGFSYFMSIVGVVCLTASCLVFLRKGRSARSADAVAKPV